MCVRYCISSQERNVVAAGRGRKLLTYLLGIDELTASAASASLALTLARAAALGATLTLAGARAGSLGAALTLAGARAGSLGAALALAGAGGATELTAPEGGVLLHLLCFNEGGNAICV